MNRRYTSEEYYEKCCILRRYFENPALTTDVIVGFPGETEEEFQKSRDFVDKVNFYETAYFQIFQAGGHEGRCHGKSGQRAGKSPAQRCSD